MNLPDIGDIITTKEALKLGRHFDLDYLVERIESDPENYKDWVFDGCSGLPDELMGLFTGCNWKDITYKCCLPHDLCYGYGELGADIERKRVDVKLEAGELTVQLRRFINPEIDYAARHICEDLNRMNPVTLDKQRLPIRYEVL